MSALAAVRSSSIDPATNTTSSDMTGSYPATPQDAYDLLDSSFSEYDSSTAHLTADSLQALSVAEDRARFSYEVLATREYSMPQLQDRSKQGKLASQLFASYARETTPDNYIDTRQRVYNVQELIEYRGTNASTHTSMPVSASIELDTALEEMRSAEGNHTNPNSAMNSSSESNVQLFAVVSWIRMHFIHALQEGHLKYPRYI